MYLNKMLKIILTKSFKDLASFRFVKIVMLIIDQPLIRKILF